MNKLKLDIDALRVESFEPAVAVRQARGTVRGNAEKTSDCLGVLGGTDYECSFNCTNDLCTDDEQCLMATLPPKCL